MKLRLSELYGDPEPAEESTFWLDAAGNPVMPIENRSGNGYWAHTLDLNGNDRLKGPYGRFGRFAEFPDLNFSLREEMDTTEGEIVFEA